MSQTTSKHSTAHKNKRKSISKVFHAQTVFQIGFYLVPTVPMVEIVPNNFTRFPTMFTCTLFQDSFKDVQVGSRWFSTLYILSPNFHNKSFGWMKHKLLKNNTCSTKIHVSACMWVKNDGYIPGALVRQNSKVRVRTYQNIPKHMQTKHQRS